MHLSRSGRCVAHVAVLLAAAGLLSACSKAPPAQEEVRPVRVMTVAPAATTLAAELSGEVRPRVESRVGFQVAGRITQRRVEVGQRVKSGQVLAVLDAADYQLGAAAAKAQLAAAQVDRDQQRVDFKRFEELNRQGFISGAELERRRAALDAAEARFEAAAAQASVSGNQATYATLRAPEGGVVTSIDAEVGQVVAAGQSVVRIAQSSEKEVLVALPESRFDQLRRIPEVRVSLWSGRAELRGRVREIAPIADTATRTYPARIALIDAPADVALGMTATVRFEAPLPQPVITVPMQALLREGDATYVWKLDAARTRVSRHAVQVATIAGNDLVIANGVAPGDVLVTAGVHLLKEGQQVKLLADASPPVPSMAPIGKPQSAPHADPKAADAAPKS